MAFLENFFKWFDRKIEKINVKDISETITDKQQRFKDVMMRYLNSKDIDKRSRKKLAALEKQLNKEKTLNEKKKLWINNEVQNQIDINNLDKKAERDIQIVKRKRVLNEINNTLKGLHQKLMSMKKGIKDEDINIVNNLFTNIRIKIGLLPTLRPYSDDFARIIISINEIIRYQGINSGTIDVLIELCNGALVKFNDLRARI